MRKFTQLLMVFLAPVAFGQTNYQIDAQAMAWSPNDITIEIGDSVTWKNTNNGNHNLNGTTATYPANPESFSMLTTGQSWTFGKRFNTAGIYMYRCDVHSANMIGKVTVVDPSLGIGNNQISAIHFGPNPASEFITIHVESADFKVQVYDMLGNLVMSETLVNQNQLNVASLRQGMYLLEIKTTTGTVQERLLKN
jgi:plastocyanin